MRKLLLILYVLISQVVVNCSAGNNPDQVLVHFTSSLEGATIRYDNDEKLFYIIHEDKEVEVQNCFVDTMIRNCTTHYLISFIASGGYLVVKQFDDGEVYIKAKMRLNGGGTLVPEGHWLQRLIIACFDLPHVEYCPEKKEVVRKKPRPGFSGIPSEDGHFKLSTKLLLNDLDRAEIKRVKITESDIKVGPCFPDNKPVDKPSCIVGGSLPHVAHIPHIKLPPAKPAGPNGRPLVGQTILV